MGNCKDCKFWDRRWQDTNKMATCYAFGYLDDGKKREENDAAFDLRVLDDSGLQHDFKTKPMFGCVRFQSV